MIRKNILTHVEREQAFSTLANFQTTLLARGWLPASLSLSIHKKDLLENETLHVITAKYCKEETANIDNNFVFVNDIGQSIEESCLQPSAEFPIHREIYRLTGCGAIFHVNTVYSNLISELFWESKQISLERSELIWPFNHLEDSPPIAIPILSNYAEITKITAVIESSIIPAVCGFLLKKNGIYVWGSNAVEAQQILEGFEFSFNYLYHRLLLSKGLEA